MDLKSTFDAELALDMAADMDDDVAEIRKQVPSLDESAARDILTEVVCFVLKELFPPPLDLLT